MALIDQIIGVESGGDPNAKNPNSSASGAGQFIDSTWLAMLAKHRPDLAGSREELLALKSDPNLSKAMVEAYAADNGQILQGAGHQVTPGSTYLAHFAGPQGAVSVLNADPSAPVSQILGEKVVRANPFLANMTVGDLRTWADKKMGGASLTTTPARTPIPASAMTPFVPQAPALPSSATAMQSTQGAAQSGMEAPQSYFASLPAEQAASPPPIFAPQRKPVDISKLKAALGNRGPSLFRA